MEIRENGRIVFALHVDGSFSMTVLWMSNGSRYAIRSHFDLPLGVDISLSLAPYNGTFQQGKLLGEPIAVYNLVSVNDVAVRVPFCDKELEEDALRHV